MMHYLVIRLAIRWFANSFGLWIAAKLISDIQYGDDIGVIIVTGLVLSLVNASVKPLLIILSLPAIVFSLGLFIIILNGFMVYLASLLVSSFDIGTFGAAVLAGLIIGLVNYAITTIFEDKRTIING